MGEANYKLLKIIVYAFNLVLLLVGIALIVIGSLYLTAFKHDHHFAQFSVQAASIAFLVIGSVMVLFSLLGLAVLRIEGKLLVLVHLAGLLVAFVTLATLGIWGILITYNGDLEATTRKELFNSLNNYNDTNNATSYTQELNWLQQKFKCCGVDSYLDWQNNTSVYAVQLDSTKKFDDSFYNRIRNQNRSTVELPDSCCVAEERVTYCGKEFQDLDKINTRGCFRPFYDWLANDMKVICGIASGLALLSLIALALLVYVCLSLKADYSPLSTNA